MVVMPADQQRGDAEDTVDYACVPVVHDGMKLTKKPPNGRFFYWKDLLLEKSFVRGPDTLEADIDRRLSAMVGLVFEGFP